MQDDPCFMAGIGPGDTTKPLITVSEVGHSQSRLVLEVCESVVLKS